MLKAQQSMTVISGTQFQRSSYLPSDVMRKLVSRGPTSAARDLLKSFGWNGVDAVATPMVRIDPVQGKLMGEWVFFLFHVLSVTGNCLTVSLSFSGLWEGEGGHLVMGHDSSLSRTMPSVGKICVF